MLEHNLRIRGSESKTDNSKQIDLMKHILIMLLVAVSTTGVAQKKNSVEIPQLPKNAETGLIAYSARHAVDGVSSGDLYDRAFKWAGDNYKNLGEKLRVQNREEGRLEIFGRFPVFAHDKKGELTNSKIALVQYTFGIDFKDGKYRYSLSKINQKASSYQPIEQWEDPNDPNRSNNAYKLIDIDLHIQALLEGFNKAVQTAPKDKKDDW